MKQYLLGIDVGTTGTKTLLFSAEGQLLGHAYRPYPLHQPQVGRSEQNAGLVAGCLRNCPVSLYARLSYGMTPGAQSRGKPI